MAAVKPLVIFVLGGPGAGKGTQCANIVQVSISYTWYTGPAIEPRRNLVSFISLPETY